MKFLRMLLCELGHPQTEPTLIWEDNKSCILSTENVLYTPSGYNYSDILTKPLTELMFQRMIDLLYLKIHPPPV